MVEKKIEVTIQVPDVDELLDELADRVGETLREAPDRA